MRQIQVLLWCLLTTAKGLVGDHEYKTATQANVRVFILVGQSNMQGKGSIQHLDALLTDPLTKSTYQHYGTPGNYTKRSEVYIYFQDRDVYKGPLTVGFGNPYGQNFGPELEFGWIVGDATASEFQNSRRGKPNENTPMKTRPTVLLIKCAWGGKSLAVDFRPPSSGISNYTRCPGKNCTAYNATDYGLYYRMTLSTIRTAVSMISSTQFMNQTLLSSSLSPNSNLSYEIAGLVWFQGWNDVIDKRMVAEYDKNLANFIRDIRADLGTPNLPIVIGELGQAGPIPSGMDASSHVQLRRQMRKVAQSEEFVTSTRYVMTSVFLNSQGQSFNEDYHYYGRADTVFYIGRAFGTAMIQLLEDYEPIVRNVSSVPSAQKV